MDRPRSIEWFLFIYIASVGIAISAIGRTVLIGPTPGVSTSALIFSATFIIGLLVGLAYKIYEGRNWARTSYVVLFALQIFSMLTWERPSSALASLDWSQTALQGMGLVLLYTPESRMWFKEMRSAGL